MGLGPPILALYRQLKLLGTFEGIDSVVELGSQGVWCPDRRLLFGLFEAFGRPIPSRDILIRAVRALRPRAICMRCYASNTTAWISTAISGR